MEEYICPHCQRPIYDEDALLCHFCGESLRRSGKRLLGKMKYGRPKHVLPIIISVVLLSFIIMYIVFR